MRASCRFCRKVWQPSAKVTYRGQTFHKRCAEKAYARVFFGSPEQIALDILRTTFNLRFGGAAHGLLWEDEQYVPFVTANMDRAHREAIKLIASGKVFDV